MEKEKDNKKKGATVEISRSFSYKMGQPNYSSADFFCSATETCEKDKAGEVAVKLHEFCKASVQNSIAEFLEAIAAKEKAERDGKRVETAAKTQKLEVKDGAKQGAELDAGAATAENLTYQAIDEGAQ